MVPHCPLPTPSSSPVGRGYDRTHGEWANIKGAQGSSLPGTGGPAGNGRSRGRRDPEEFKGQGPLVGSEVPGSSATTGEGKARVSIRVSFLTSPSPSRVEARPRQPATNMAARCPHLPPRALSSAVLARDAGPRPEPRTTCGSRARPRARAGRAQGRRSLAAGPGRARWAAGTRADIRARGRASGGGAAATVGRSPLAAAAAAAPAPAAVRPPPPPPRASAARPDMSEAARDLSPGAPPAVPAAASEERKGKEPEREKLPPIVTAGAAAVGAAGAGGLPGGG